MFSTGLRSGLLLVMSTYRSNSGLVRGAPHTVLSTVNSPGLKIVASGFLVERRGFT